MDKSRLIMDPAEVIARCDENTIGVVPTLGVTFTGQYEPVEAVSKALDALQQEKGWDIPIHVDKGQQGFLAPFVQPDLVWDFRLPRVRSINASGHKFGLAPLGVGWVVWREKRICRKSLFFNVNYLGGNMPTFALNFSRPGGKIVAQYYNFLRLGRRGYRRIHQACYEHGPVSGQRDRQAGAIRGFCITERAASPPCAGVSRLPQMFHTRFTISQTGYGRAAGGFRLLNARSPRGSGSHEVLS